MLTIFYLTDYKCCIYFIFNDNYTMYIYLFMADRGKKRVILHVFRLPVDSQVSGQDIVVPPP